MSNGEAAEIHIEDFKAVALNCDETVGLLDEETSGIIKIIIMTTIIIIIITMMIGRQQNINICVIIIFDIVSTLVH